MVVSPAQSRERGQGGNSPLRSPEAAPLVGLGATPQLFHRKPVCPNAATKGAGSEASLPVTSRSRRSAPQLHIRPLTYCRARWARPTSMRHDSFSTAGLFLLQRISPLRRRPEGFAGVPYGLLRIALLCFLIFIAAREIAPASAATLGHKIAAGRIYPSSRRRLYWLTSSPYPSRPSSGQHPKSRRAASG